MIHADGEEVIGKGILWLEKNVSRYVAKKNAFVLLEQS